MTKEKQSIYQTQPQDGNQIVVNENNATINVYNYSKQNKEVSELHDKIQDSFNRMEKFFKENQFHIKKKKNK